MLWYQATPLHGGSSGILERQNAYRWLNMQGMAASNYTLPPPQPLDIHHPQLAEKWRKFKRAWVNYSLATGLIDKAEAVQVATLLTAIGEEAREVYATFTDCTSAGDEAKIEPAVTWLEQ